MSIALLFFIVWGGCLVLAALLMVAFDMFLTHRRDVMRKAQGEAK